MALVELNSADEGALAEIGPGVTVISLVNGSGIVEVAFVLEAAGGAADLRRIEEVTVGI